jgi:hypothetical protein
MPDRPPTELMEQNVIFTLCSNFKTLDSRGPLSLNGVREQGVACPNQFLDYTVEECGKVF